MNWPHGILFTALLILVLPSVAAACGCLPMCHGVETPKQCAEKRLKARGGAVYGHVVEVVQETGTPPWGRPTLFAKMKVERSWKYRTSEFVNVNFEYDNGANCGISLQVGQSYLLYTAVSAQGETSVTGCDYGPPDERKFLGKARTPKRGRR